eukprot:Clim_evm186s157 gene=Clim_evmTU186s157
MASGFGAFGGRGRCYAFMEDLKECLDKYDGNKIMCQNERDDYVECLHHKKEYTRVAAITKRKEELVKEDKLPKDLHFK